MYSMPSVLRTNITLGDPRARRRGAPAKHLCMRPALRHAHTEQPHAPWLAFFSTAHALLPREASQRCACPSCAPCFVPMALSPPELRGSGRPEAAGGGGGAPWCACCLPQILSDLGSEDQVGEGDREDDACQQCEELRRKCARRVDVVLAVRIRLRVDEEGRPCV